MSQVNVPVDLVQEEKLIVQRGFENDSAVFGAGFDGVPKVFFLFRRISEWLIFTEECLHFSTVNHSKTGSRADRSRDQQWGQLPSFG